LNDDCSSLLRLLPSGALLPSRQTFRKDHCGDDDEHRLVPGLVQRCTKARREEKPAHGVQSRPLPNNQDRNDRQSDKEEGRDAHARRLPLVDHRKHLEVSVFERI
jgi:hypothetical protein